MNEIYKDVPGFEKIYQVSNLGNVKALDRNVWTEYVSRTPHFRRYKEHILTPSIDGEGYLHVRLAKRRKIYII